MPAEPAGLQSGKRCGKFPALHEVPAEREPQTEKRTPSGILRCRGWGTWIRTTEMADSESAALPLGYTPMRSRSFKILQIRIKVKHFFKKFIWL